MHSTKTHTQKSTHRSYKLTLRAAAAATATIAVAAVITPAVASTPQPNASESLTFRAPSGMPQNGMFAFTRFLDYSGDGTHDSAREDNTTDIWTATITNGYVTLARLPQSTYGIPDFTPEWSPDGTKLAWSTKKPGGALGVRILDTTTGRTRWLTTNTARSNNERWPTWSPDGQRLLYSRRAAAGQSLDIWMANVDGSDQHKVAGVPGGVEDCCASFTGDSRSVVFASNRNKATSLFDIYRIPATNRGEENGAAVRLTNNKLYDGTPSTGPGNTVWFRRFGQIWRLDASISRIQNGVPVLTTGASRTPEADATGQWLAFGWRPTRSGPLQLRVDRTDGSFAWTLTNDSKVSSTDPSWRN